MATPGSSAAKHRFSKLPKRGTRGLLLVCVLTSSPLLAAEDVVTFPSGKITLRGVIYRPEGAGPFPAVLYNHGSAPGILLRGRHFR